jgi:hypothetical protein
MIGLVSQIPHLDHKQDNQMDDLIVKTLIPPFLDFLTEGLLVYISILFNKDIAHDRTGLGEFFNSTKHILQFPATDKLG